jgi:hypothetical protein
MAVSLICGQDPNFSLASFKAPMRKAIQQVNEREPTRR